MINYRITSSFIFILYIFYLAFLVDYALATGKGDLVTYQAYAERGPEAWLEYENTSLSLFSYPKFFFMVTLGKLNSLVPFNLLLFLSIAIFTIIFRSFLMRVKPSYLNLFGFFLVILHPRVFHLFMSNYRTGISLALILPLLSYEASRIKLSIMSVISSLHSSTIFLMIFVIGERIMRSRLNHSTLRFVLIICFIILFSVMVNSGFISGEPWNANALYTASTLTLFLIYISCTLIFKCKNDSLFSLLSYAFGFAFVVCILNNISGVRFFSIFLLISVFSISEWSKDARILYLISVMFHCLLANYYYFL
tara:strand:+ start:1467 stop:2390 length:924 start_codon:yes stop_codon:yes gene_type:complete